MSQATWPHALGFSLLLVSQMASAALFDRPAADLLAESRAAASNGKLLAVFLTLPDCAGCLEMERSVWSDLRLQRAIGARFQTLRLDLSGSRNIIDPSGRSILPADFARQLHAYATPSLVFFNGRGEFLYRHTGTLDRQGVRALADYVRFGRYEQQPFVAPAASGPAAPLALFATPPAATLPRQPSFQLAGSDGKTHRAEDFRGKVIALAVGYTHCPDVCPTTLAELKSAVEGLPAEQRAAVQVLFASLDPERDNAAFLKDYVRAFQPRGGQPILGLRGTPEQTRAFIAELQLVAEKRDSDSLGYSLDHTAGIFLLDRAGRLRGISPYGQPLAQLRADLQALATPATTSLSTH